MTDLMDRAGDLKGELVDFALSPRFATTLKKQILRRFPGGVVNDEGRFASVIESFLFEPPFSVVDDFVADRPDLSDPEREMLLGWKDGVIGFFEIQKFDGDDAVIAVNLIDELTYRIRSNMGAEGVSGWAAGEFMLSRIVQVGSDWMISGAPARFTPDQAADILPVAAKLAAESPTLVFRNPEKLAQGWKKQTEQRDSFIELYGSDLIVVPGKEANDTLSDFYRFDYERHAAPDAKEFRDPGITLPEEWQEAESVAMIYDAEDGLGFYLDFAVAEEAFEQPALIVRRRHRELISEYLQGDLSPVPLRRLAERDTDKADQLFRKFLKKPKFSWERDGEALLRKYKPGHFAKPRLPRVTIVSEALAAHLRGDER